MCKVLKISKSGYYRWLNAGESTSALKAKEDAREIIAIYNNSKKRYGSYKITKELQHKGIQTSRNRVARIMKKEGIRSIINKKYKIQTTDSSHSLPASENILNRDFLAKEPGLKWVSDITYIRTEQGWLYLTIILDLFDRKVIGWSLSDDMSCKNTIMKAWSMALINRVPQTELIFHSDRGVQYAAKEFRKEIAKCKVIQSMSRKGNCWDNAVAENFFKIIKSELVYHRYYYSHFQAKIEIFEFIESWYNKKRIHSILGYLTPEEYGKIKFKNAA